MCRFVCSDSYVVPNLSTLIQEIPIPKILITPNIFRACVVLLKKLCEKDSDRTKTTVCAGKYVCSEENSQRFSFFLGTFNSEVAFLAAKKIIIIQINNKQKEIKLFLK